MDWAEHPLLNKLLLIVPPLVVLFFIANIIALDVFFIRTARNDKKQDQTLTALQARDTNKVESTAQPELTTPLQVNPTVGAKTPTSKSVIVNSGSKEFYVPIGTSSFYSVDDWGDVPGAQVYIDSRNYQEIKNVMFEASIHVPNANEDVSVRLYNDTDNHPVTSSELFFPSDTTTHLLASQIHLDSGMKLYKVQMKTQFDTPASLDQSRIHITTR